jgi:prepilin-type N-terminal cleavage/methylation domain-containing protein
MINKLNQNHHEILRAILKRPNLINSCTSTQSDTGFSLLEVIVVTLMIGILSAIVAPAWLGFVNRQTVNKANDVILAALQEAQREAKKDKRNYSLSFKTVSNVPQIAIHPGGTTPNNWRNLGQDVGIEPEKILLASNLTNVNTTTTNIALSNSTEKTITFDYMGILAAKSDGTASDIDLKIVLGIRNPNNPTSLGSTKRCVIVKTLLGSMMTEKDSQCD